MALLSDNGKELLQDMVKRILIALALTVLLAPILSAETTATAPTPPTAAEIVANLVARLSTLLDLTT